MQEQIGRGRHRAGPASAVFGASAAPIYPVLPPLDWRRRWLSGWCHWRAWAQVAGRIWDLTLARGGIRSMWVASPLPSCRSRSWSSWSVGMGRRRSPSPGALAPTC